MNSKIAKLKADIESGNEHAFYCTSSWKRTRDAVLKLDNYECQMCKAEGRYSRGEIVHHIHHLKEYPDLALSIYDRNGERNLIAICKYHHDLEHPEHQVQFISKHKPLTDERWD